ncbi:MAG: hypothetical protein DI556_00755 [Rhodovulum sulfidophilum]|uniref:Uncharacterized protein n=1 Tax=Rhodovulum sulfidophilum TaxID=35806 RepID=A0A2W5Q4F7_RHOSU|nr:MAG: hypothetical protein DI556_00755 [Rhodovulum sulfidophilum]
MTARPDAAGRPGALPGGTIRSGPRGPLATPPRRLAALASLGWAALVAAYAFGFAATASAARGTVGLDLLFFLLALALPVALFWITAFLADELARLRAAVAGFAEAIPGLAADLAETRAVLAAEGPVSPADIARAVRVAMADEARVDLSEPLERLQRGQEEIRGELRAIAADPRWTRPAGKPTSPRASEKPPEPRPEPVAEPVPGWPDLVRALNFPRDEADKEGFRALRVALRHSGLAQTLQAAEDALTLLSEVGIYMDDFVVEAPPAEVWRRYIAGARGPEVAAAGAVTDAEAIGKVRTLFAEDPIFRDTAQHFQRRFDATLSAFGAGAADADLLSLVDTRSGRAFMLLARARGAFG